MMPCPWVPEMVAYAKARQELDAGLHLTLNAEWKSIRWVPFSGVGVVPGPRRRRRLPPPRLCLRGARLASPDEVDKEVRAQLERARRMGLKPTHLDSHMGTVMLPKFIETYAAGHRGGIPVMMPAGHMQHVGAKVGPLNRAPLQQLA